MESGKMRALHHLIAVAILALITTACATTGSRESTQKISYEELQEATSAATLHDVVRQLRPRWLRARARSFAPQGTESVIGVYEGETWLGDVSVLREYAPSKVYELRFIDAPKDLNALPRRSGQHVVAAILLVTSPSRDQ